MSISQEFYHHAKKLIPGGTQLLSKRALRAVAARAVLSPFVSPVPPQTGISSLFAATTAGPTDNSEKQGEKR